MEGQTVVLDDGTTVETRPRFDKTCPEVNGWMVRCHAPDGTHLTITDDELMFACDDLWEPLNAAARGDAHAARVLFDNIVTRINFNVEE